MGSEILIGIGSPRVTPPPPTFVKKRPENATATANVGKSRKVWGNIMELIVKIEKTNTMTNMEKDKDKNVLDF